jgi:hypothetical protein
MNLRYSKQKYTAIAKVKNTARKMAISITLCSSVIVITFFPVSTEPISITEKPSYLDIAIVFICIPILTILASYKFLQTVYVGTINFYNVFFHSHFTDLFAFSVSAEPIAIAEINYEMMS